MASKYAYWPDWMPAPQQDSFSIQPEDRRLTSETEAGSIIRYQFDTDVNVADVTLILSRPQAAWFESFERDILRQGTVWFDFPLWIGGEVVYESCRFKTRPKAGSLIGLHTTYTFQLYVSKRSQLAFPPCLMEVFVCWPPCFFFKLDGALRETLGVLSHVTQARLVDSRMSKLLAICKVKAPAQQSQQAAPAEEDKPIRVEEIVNANSGNLQRDKGKGREGR